MKIALFALALLTLEATASPLKPNCGNRMKEQLTGKTATIDWEKVIVKNLARDLKRETEIALKKIDAIGKAESSATIKNTIQAYLEADEAVYQLGSIFGTLELSQSNKTFQGIQKEFKKSMIDYENSLYFNEGFFERLKVLNKKFQGNAVVEKLYSKFVRRGAALSTEKKIELGKVNQEISDLETEFTNNVQKQLNELKVIIEDVSELDGVPQSTIEKIKDKKMGKYVVTFRGTAPSDILTYCKNRKLREKITYASAQLELSLKYLSKEELGAYSPDDNAAVIEKLVKARDRQAKLLGFKSHAHYQLDDRMAKTPETAWKLTQEIANAALKKAKAELNEIKAYAQDKHGVNQLEPWDLAFYSNLYENDKLNFDEEQFKQYFEYNHTFKKTLEFIGKLYNIEFIEDKKTSGFSKDATVYRVWDKRLKKEVGSLIADPYNSKIKKPGAWAQNVLDQGMFSDGMHRPQVSVNFNFDRPHGKHPTLLTPREVETILHEMGHAMHQLFSDVQYRTLNGFSVVWDFVEFPSTIMENWLSDPEYIQLVSRNVKDGSSLPLDWIEKIRRKTNFQKGLIYLGTAGLALMDLEFHTRGIKSGESIFDFEKRTRGPFALFPEHPFVMRSLRFGHLFASNAGYSAGYYSYLWSETIEADGFEYWNENPKERSKKAQQLRDRIFRYGASLDETDMYVSWRGRNFTTDAFFKKNDLK